jgi:hypothetical protein
LTFLKRTRVATKKGCHKKLFLLTLEGGREQLKLLPHRPSRPAALSAYPDRWSLMVTTFLFLPHFLPDPLLHLHHQSTTLPLPHLNLILNRESNCLIRSQELLKTTNTTSQIMVGTMKYQRVKQRSARTSFLNSPNLILSPSTERLVKVVKSQQ